MKDRHLRAAVSALSKRVTYLQEEIKILKKPHTDGCRCRLCRPRYNPFITSFMELPEMNKILKGEYKL